MSWESGRSAEPSKVVSRVASNFLIDLAGGFDYFGAKGAESLWLLAHQSGKVFDFVVNSKGRSMGSKQESSSRPSVT